MHELAEIYSSKSFQLEEWSSVPRAVCLITPPRRMLVEGRMEGNSLPTHMSIMKSTEMN